MADEADNYYNNQFLMQHALLSDLAIDLSNENPLEHRVNLIIDINKNNHPELWSEPKKKRISLFSQKQKQVTARSISISSGLISLSLYRLSHFKHDGLLLPPSNHMAVQEVVYLLLLMGRVNWKNSE